MNEKEYESLKDQFAISLSPEIIGSVNGEPDDLAELNLNMFKSDMFDMLEVKFPTELMVEIINEIAQQYSYSYVLIELLIALTENKARSLQEAGSAKE